MEVVATSGAGGDGAFSVLWSFLAASSALAFGPFFRDFEQSRRWIWPLNGVVSAEQLRSLSRLDLTAKAADRQRHSRDYSHDP